MEELKWEFEYQEEPRRLNEIMEAEHVLFRQVWYNRHWNLRSQIERGKHKVVSREEWEKYPKHRRGGRPSILSGRALWLRRSGLRKKSGAEENLGPWSDFEWGMLNGKLSALRWVMGSESDPLIRDSAGISALKPDDGDRTRTRQKAGVGASPGLHHG